MALTCSHKILKVHSNEAPGHNAAVAMHSVEQDTPPSEREGRILLATAQFILVV